MSGLCLGVSPLTRCGNCLTAHSYCQTSQFEGLSPVTAPKPAKSAGKNPPTRRSQQQRNDEMRALLAKAAYDEIAEKGHSSFRTAPVFARAGVSKGGMQHYFPTKNSLTLAAVEYAFDQANLMSAEFMQRPVQSARDVLNNLLDDLEEYFGHNRFLVSLDITLHAAKSETLASEIRRRISDARTPIYRRWAERFEQFGYSAVNARFLVETATLLASGAAIRKLWTPLDPAIKQKWITMILEQQLSA